MTGEPSWTLAPDRLETRLPDRKPLYTAWEAAAEASRCLYCHDAPCIRACPTAIDVPSFIRKIATGALRGAARTILRANLLGLGCARVCPVEVLCEGACVYVGWQREPIAIGRLQRYAMERGAVGAVLGPPPAARSSHTVGLVGAGPASLAGAGRLALRGHRAVIYERAALPGGLHSTGIAPYKLWAATALEEIEHIQSLGVEIQTGVTVGGAGGPSPGGLLERHDAVFLGPGLGADARLEVPGETGAGVIGATAWIRRLKTEPGFSIDGVEQAIVVGGGNTAVDAARELKGLGVESVMLVYRRRRSVMKAYAHELDGARREGVALLEEATVAAVLRDAGGALRGVRLVATEDGQPTDTVLHEVSADLLVVAIGQSSPRALAERFPGVVCDARGRIVIDPATGATGNPRVFAGGDAVNGGKEVVNAVHDGQVAADAMEALFAQSRRNG